MQTISWTEYTDPNYQLPTVNCQLAITIGVFDGVHLGHQALIQRICAPSATHPLSTVVTFRQNPLQILKPRDFPGDIFSFGQKMRVFEEMGVQQLVVIDFSENFSTISGRDFIDLLLRSSQVKFLALGRNFRCGCGLDTGVREIVEQAAARGVETWVADPVLENGRPISSSRIRQAIAAGDIAEAARLLGRNVEIDLAGLPADISFPNGALCRSYDAAAAFRITPNGRYRACVFGCNAATGCDATADNSVNGTEADISITDGKILISAAEGTDQFIPQRIELLRCTQ
jgi:riboflavin kinase/FMN adenylyltransferase